VIVRLLRRADFPLESAAVAERCANLARKSARSTWSLGAPSNPMPRAGAYWSVAHGPRRLSAVAKGTKPTKKRGRPPGGRSSDPDRFASMTIYVDRSVREAVLARLLRADEKQNFSELVETLLRRWLAG
jgi:hypothetical protein